MAICEQWLIYGKINEAPPEDYDENNKEQIMYDESGKFGSPIVGGIRNGYNEKQLKDFWKSLEGYANYLFNLSHSACYSYLTMLTAYLKTYHPVEFMASLLSAAGVDKIEKYVNATERMGISISTPDINLSKADFSPVGKGILYGLSSVKGVGDSSLDELINNQPYESMEDMLERLPKKVINKRVGVALIKSGSLDRFDKNRYALVNHFYDLRKDKDDRYNINLYDEEACIEFEKEILGSSITYKPWWEGIKENEKIKDEIMSVKSVQEKVDKNGNLMAFVTLKKNSEEIRGIIFSSNYAIHCGLINNDSIESLLVTGKKDSNGTLIINSVKLNSEKQEQSIMDFIFRDL